MRKFFMAVDDSVFDTEEACKAHEASILEYKGVYMWNGAGDRTTDVDGAYFVYLEGEDAARVFLDLNAADPSYAKGIDEGDLGFFSWSFEEGHYIYVGGTRRMYVDLGEILRKQSRC